MYRIAQAQCGSGGTGAGYSLHEFTRGPLRAESHEVIHTDNSPRVPVPTQGTCGAKRQVTQTFPFFGACPCAPLAVRALPRPLCRAWRARAGLQMLALPLIHRGHWAGHTTSQIQVSLSKKLSTQELWEVQVS